MTVLPSHGADVGRYRAILSRTTYERSALL